MIELLVSEERTHSPLQHRQLLESVANAVRSFCSWFEGHDLLVVTARRGCYFLLNLFECEELVLWLDLPHETQALYRHNPSGFRRSLLLQDVACQLPMDLIGSGYPVQEPSVYLPHMDTVYPIVKWESKHYVVLPLSDDDTLRDLLERYQSGYVVPLPTGASCVQRDSDIVIGFQIGGLPAQALFWTPDPTIPGYDAYLRYQYLAGSHRLNLPILRQRLYYNRRWLDLIKQHGWFPLLVTDLRTKLVPTVLRCAAEEQAVKRAELGHYLAQQMEPLWSESRTWSGERWGDLCARFGLNAEFMIDSHAVRTRLADPVLLERARVHRIFWLPINMTETPQSRLKYGPVAVDCTVDGQRMVVAPLSLQYLLALPYQLSTTLKSLP